MTKAKDHRIKIPYGVETMKRARLDEIIREERYIMDPIHPSVVPPIHCADGFRISIQASNTHYCLDKDGNRPGFLGMSLNTVHHAPYTAFEVGFPSARPEPWHQWVEYADNKENPTESIYSYVPLEMVEALIYRHGGEA